MLDADKYQESIMAGRSQSEDRLRDIKKLPLAISSMTRSCINITSYSQCITELVCNSLDAGATCVAIRVDFNSHTIQVVDNGHGIDKKNLEVVAERHMTSKIQSIHDLDNCLNKYGYRGEALASIREVSRSLLIESRSSSSQISYEKLFKIGKPSTVKSSEDERPCPGLTVTVSDFLYNVPVRRKKFEEHFELEDIRSQLEVIALLNPQVSFTFKNDVTGKMLLEIRKCNSPKEIFSQLYGPVLADQLEEFNFTEIEGLALNGFLSIKGHYNKNYQFIYINSRIVLNTQLHKTVENLLSWNLRKDKKNKHPVFILNLTCPYAAYDITFDPKKTMVEFKNWKAVMQTVEAALKGFLKKHHLDVPPEAKKVSKNEERTSWDLIKKTNLSKFELPRATVGMVSKRQAITSKDIVNEVLKKPKNDHYSPISRHHTVESTWKSVMPTKFDKSIANKQMKHSTPDAPGPSSANRPGLSTSVLEEEFFEQFCQAIHSSLKLFYDNNLKSTPSQPSQSESLDMQKGTGLTQEIKEIEMNSGEPPEDLFLRHTSGFEFNPIVEAPLGLNSFQDTICNAPIEEEDEDYFDPYSQPVQMYQEYRSDAAYKRDVLINEKYHRQYCDSPPQEERKPKLPDVQILQHLSPTCSTYQEIIRIFQPDEREKSPPKQHYRLGFSPLPCPEVITEEYYTPNTQFTPAKLMESSVIEFVDNSARYMPPLPTTVSPLHRDNALRLFENCNQENSENISSVLELKRPIYSPESGISSKKSKVSDEWQSCENELGQQFFVNLRTGHIKRNVPKKIDEFTINERRNYLPFGTSPIMKLAPSCELKINNDAKLQLRTAVNQRITSKEDAVASSKWYCLEEMMTEKDQRGLHNMIKTQVIDAGMRNVPELVSNDIFNDEAFVAMRSALFQHELHSNMLENPRVIGQFDKKFILALANSNTNINESKSNLVVIIDQHAAHERVRLEMLMKDYQSAENHFLSSPLHPPQNVTLSYQEVQTVQKFQSTFQKYGVECEAMSETEVRVFAAPLCFVHKQDRQAQYFKQSWNLEGAVIKVIRELAETITKTRGSCLAVPQEIREVLNSEACAGAVKFNMVLSQSACSDLVDQLSKCQQPFQCAHGRNSIYPVLNIENCRSSLVKKPNLLGFLQKLRPNNVI